MNTVISADQRRFSTTFDPVELRRALGQFPQGVVAIAAQIDGTPEVLVASSFTVGVSHDPPLATVAVQHTSSTWPKLRDQSSHLGISVLGIEQSRFARQLSSRDRAGRFHGVEHSVDEDGALSLAGSPLWFKTVLHNQFTAGDHDIAVLEIVDVRLDDSSPGLVFHQKRFKEI